MQHLIVDEATDQKLIETLTDSYNKIVEHEKILCLHDKNDTHCTHTQDCESAITLLCEALDTDGRTTEAIRTIASQYLVTILEKYQNIYHVGIFGINVPDDELFNAQTKLAEAYNVLCNDGLVAPNENEKYKKVLENALRAYDLILNQTTPTQLDAANREETEHKMMLLMYTYWTRSEDSDPIMLTRMKKYFGEHAGSSTISSKNMMTAYNWRAQGLRFAKMFDDFRLLEKKYATVSDINDVPVENQIADKKFLTELIDTMIKDPNLIYQNYRYRHQAVRALLLLEKISFLSSDLKSLKLLEFIIQKHFFEEVLNNLKPEDQTKLMFLNMVRQLTSDRYYLPESESAFDQLIEQCKKHADETKDNAWHNDIVMLYLFRGSLWLRQNKHDDAVKDFTKAIEFANNPQKSNYLLSKSYQGYAYALNKQLNKQLNKSFSSPSDIAQYFYGEGKVIKGAEKKANRDAKKRITQLIKSTKKTTPIHKPNTRIIKLSNHNKIALSTMNVPPPIINKWQFEGKQLITISEVEKLPKELVDYDASIVTIKSIFANYIDSIAKCRKFEKGYDLRIMSEDEFSAYQADMKKKKMKYMHPILVERNSGHYHFIGCKDGKWETTKFESENECNAINAALAVDIHKQQPINMQPLWVNPQSILFNTFKNYHTLNLYEIIRHENRKAPDNDSSLSLPFQDLLFAFKKRHLLGFIAGHITSLPVEEQRQVWACCRSSQTLLGGRFWKKEGLTKCNEKSGKLDIIGFMLNKVIESMEDKRAEKEAEGREEKKTENTQSWFSMFYKTKNNTPAPQQNGHGNDCDNKRDSDPFGL